MSGSPPTIEAMERIAAVHERLVKAWCGTQNASTPQWRVRHLRRHTERQGSLIYALILVCKTLAQDSAERSPPGGWAILARLFNDSLGRPICHITRASKTDGVEEEHGSQPQERTDERRLRTLRQIYQSTGRTVPGEMAEVVSALEWAEGPAAPSCDRWRIVDSRAFERAVSQYLSLLEQMAKVEPCCCCCARGSAWCRSSKRQVSRHTRRSWQARPPREPSDRPSVPLDSSRFGQAEL